MPETRQLHFFEAIKNGNGGIKDPAAGENKKLPIHRWVTWIAGFSAAFAEDTIKKYLPKPKPNSLVLDPFAGIGTTLIEAFRQGINTVGFEINPFATLVSRIKLESATVDLEMLKRAIANYQTFMAPIEKQIDCVFLKGGGTGELKDAPEPQTKAPANFKSRIAFFSPPVERKVLFTFDFINGIDNEAIQRTFKVAFGAVMISFSNYSYEPSLSSRPAAGKSLIANASVSQIVAQKLWEMANDIEQLQEEIKTFQKLPEAIVHQKSFFDALKWLEPKSIDLLVTSPPYLNNYHYVRNTRPHLYWLNLAVHLKDLHYLEKENYGSFWQTVRELKAIKLCFDLPELQEVIEYVRNLKKEKGAYGGPGWANYIATYFNDTYRFMAILKEILKPKGTAVIVVGNSIIQGVEVDVDAFFSQIAALNGLGTEGIYVVREKRIGSSIVNTGVREKSHGKPVLYDAAVVLKR